MKLELTVEEALQLQRSQKPLPAEVESIASSDDTLIVKIDAREKLPRLLQKLAPKLTLDLTFEQFEAGRAAFRVTTALSALPVTALAQLLLKLVSLPELRGVDLKIVGDKAEGERIVAWVDIQTLVAEQVEGLTVSDFKLEDNTFVIEADIGVFKLKT